MKLKSTQNKNKKKLILYINNFNKKKVNQTSLILQLNS